MTHSEGDQVAYRRSDEVDRLGELTDTEIYQGELEAGVNDDLPTEPDAENIESLTALELRAGETGNADVAAEEGMTWIPPIDPPVVPDHQDPEGIKIAAGFGITADDEPYDEDHHGETVPVDDEMADRVREALTANAATSAYADRLAIGVIDGRVAVRGVVDDIVDTDNVIEVISSVTGVVEVKDELEVPGVTD